MQEILRYLEGFEELPITFHVAYRRAIGVLNPIGNARLELELTFLSGGRHVMQIGTRPWA